MNKSNTLLQTRLIILREQINADPELKEQLQAYNKLVDEFGTVELPIYLKEKFAELDILTEARLRSFGQIN